MARSCTHQYRDSNSGSSKNRGSLVREGVTTKNGANGMDSEHATGKRSKTR